jgi:hypothetical protein
MVRSPLFLTRFPLGPVEISIHAPCAMCVLKQRQDSILHSERISANRKLSNFAAAKQFTRLVLPAPALRLCARIFFYAATAAQEARMQRGCMQQTAARTAFWREIKRVAAKRAAKSRKIA